MNLELSKKLAEQIGWELLKEFNINERKFQEMGTVGIPLISFNKEKIEKIKDSIMTRADTEDRKNVLKMIEEYLEIMTNDKNMASTVEMGALVMIKYVETFPEHKIYIQNPNNKKNYPYKVTSIEFMQETQHNKKHVILKSVYEQFGVRKTKDVIFHLKDLKDVAIAKVFSNKNIQLENDELKSKDLADMVKFNQMHKKVGMQCILNGITTDEVANKPVRFGEKYNIFSSANYKVVIDVFGENIEEQDNQKIDEMIDDGTEFWKKQTKMFREFHSENYDETVNTQTEIPVHPDVIIFDLKRHMRMICHIDFINEYQYQDDATQSLIIEDEKRDLIIDIIEHGNNEFKDIVRDKSGGLIVMLVGPPGVGKTLTVEVIAEIQKKPLYIIQPSLLGVEPEIIEEELYKCFERGKRWDAIILIDEADMYIHQRGMDLKQNSIVGRFLKSLEYYPGILFMTCNSANIIDDAIISRCIVVIDYPLPNESEQKKIWKVLIKSVECEIADRVLQEAVQEYHKFTGRDIKNILKLIKITSGKNEITTEMLRESVKHIPKFENSVKDTQKNDEK